MIKKIFIFFFLFSFLDVNLQIKQLYGIEENSSKNEIKSVIENESIISESENGVKSKKAPISILWVLPFFILLLSIAILPLLAPNFWHHFYWKYSLFLFAFPMLFLCLFFFGPEIRENAFHEIESYISFILLISSLFIISGAIYIQGNWVGTPKFNTTILFIGSILASFMGTTGASMLLIRPLIKANLGRKKVTHIFVFFIFIVSNTGGLLTPLGDPPLFLGYLKGVPFTWTFFNLGKEWLFINSCLLILFFAIESFFYSKESKQKDSKENIPFNIKGKIQFLFLLGVILCIYFQGYFVKLADTNPNFYWPKFGPQEIGMLLMIILSLLVSPPKHIIRQKNHFSFFPIKEVSAIFAGIFASMIPALYFLKTYGSYLQVDTAREFFWMTGAFSSFLDNAPTYLVFLELAKAITQDGSVIGLLTNHPSFLQAISTSAVFMGAMTYIGNAPNFMIYSITKENKIPMPSFFGYILYSVSILLPFYFLLTIIFFD